MNAAYCSTYMRHPGGIIIDEVSYTLAYQKEEMSRVQFNTSWKISEQAKIVQFEQTRTIVLLLVLPALTLLKIPNVDRLEKPN